VTWKLLLTIGHWHTDLSEDDLDEPLTPLIMPFHLIQGRGYIRRNLGRRNTDIVPNLSLGQCKDRLVHLQKVLKDCWVRFRREYLNELRRVN
jgi:hypothetical protein